MTEIHRKELVFSDARWCWLSHIPRCCARVTLPKDILGFVRYSFSKEPPPPRQVIAGCLRIILMIIGRLPEFEDRMVKRLVTRRSSTPLSTDRVPEPRRSRSLYEISTRVLGWASRRIPPPPGGSVLCIF